MADQTIVHKHETGCMNCCLVAGLLGVALSLALAVLFAGGFYLALQEQERKEREQKEKGPALIEPAPKEKLLTARSMGQGCRSAPTPPPGG